MLRVDVDQVGAEFAQLRQLHREVVDESAALAGRGYHARYGSLRRIVEVVPGEESLHVAPREVEGTSTTQLRAASFMAEPSFLAPSSRPRAPSPGWISRLPFHP